jgi:hypothetical protein
MSDKRTVRLDWEDIRYFRALARVGSLSAAAADFASIMPHSRPADRRAGGHARTRALFDRRPDGYAPRGSRCWRTPPPWKDRFSLSRIVCPWPGGASGPVRLITVRSLADRFLVDQLGDLRRQYPGIRLEIVADSRVMSLARREADIALRLGRP